MANIYTNAQGVQVYDLNGQTYNAKTGQVYVPPASPSTPPPSYTPASTTSTNTPAKDLQMSYDPSSLASMQAAYSMLAQNAKTSNDYNLLSKLDSQIKAESSRRGAIISKAQQLVSSGAGSTAINNYYASLSPMDQGLVKNMFGSNIIPNYNPQTGNVQTTYMTQNGPSTYTTGSNTAYPTTNLQPGDTGDQVKKLQDYLVSKGLMTQEQVNTGYGTYGPQTTAAVKKLQEQLGVDNSSGVGYFGPRTIAAITKSAPASGTTPASDAAPAQDPVLTQILSNPNLDAGQKKILVTADQVVKSGDTDLAGRLIEAMKAASEFSDPYFKAQVRLATDALQRGISAKEGDLAFAEQQQKAALDELRANTAASKEYLSLEHAQELKRLESKYQQDLATTQDNLAATGFTSSSRRNRAEQILNENNQGLVESSNRKYGYDIGNLDRSLTTGDANTQAQIVNLKRLAAEGKIDLLRKAEKDIGTANLQPLGYTGLLGNIGGDLERQKVLDSASFANNFVF